MDRAKQEWKALFAADNSPSHGPSGSKKNDGPEEWDALLEALQPGHIREPFSQWLLQASSADSPPSTASTDSSNYSCIASILLDCRFEKPRLGMLSVLRLLSSPQKPADETTNTNTTSEPLQAFPYTKPTLPPVGVHFVPHLLWLYLSLPVLQDLPGTGMPMDAAEDPTVYLTAEQAKLWKLIVSLSDAIETCWVDLYLAQVQQRKNISAPTPSATSTADGSNTKNTHQAKLHREARLRDVCKPGRTSMYHRRTGTQKAPAHKDIVAHALSDGSHSAPLDPRVVAVTPATLPKILECLMQMLESRMGKPLRPDAAPLSVDSLLVFCLAAERLLVTDLAYTPVPHRPDIPTHQLMQMPAPVVRFYRHSNYVWSQLRILNGDPVGPGGPPTYAVPTPSLSRRIRSLSLSTTASLPRPASAANRNRGDSIRRSIVLQQHNQGKSPLASQNTTAAPNASSSGASVTTQTVFRPATRICLTRETARAILSILFVILKDTEFLKEKPPKMGVDREVNRLLFSTAPIAADSPWQAAFTRPKEGLVPKEPYQSNVSPLPVLLSQDSVNLDEEAASMNTSRRATVSFGELPSAMDRPPSVPKLDDKQLPPPIEEASVEDIHLQIGAPFPLPPTGTSTAVAEEDQTAYIEILHAMAKRTLAKLRLRARYEMWWEIVMAADQPGMETIAVGPISKPRSAAGGPAASSAVESSITVATGR